MFRFAAATLIFFLSVTATAADDLVIREASIAPASTLPGLPYWISFSVTNSGRQPLALPRAYRLEVTAPSGETFVARCIEETTVALPDAFLVLTIAPGETRRVEFPTGHDVGDGWMLDSRLRNPGTYHLRLRFAKSDLATPVMTVTVEEPAGLEAEAWKALLARTRGTALLHSPKAGDIGQDFWTAYRETRYAPYFGIAASNEVRRNGGEGRFARADAILDEVLAIDRDGIATKDFAVSRAVTKRFAALARPDLASAVRLMGEARADLETIAANANRELTRHEARRQLQLLETDEQLRAQFLSLKRPLE